ncbi:MAG: hypothetical protein M1829_002694 [Trizodia sp. TS-e1964]|nr:MAG: hypothetical protein M1829_002694 [Trizodia sp. TS-e1964]
MGNTLLSDEEIVPALQALFKEAIDLSCSEDGVEDLAVNAALELLPSEQFDIAETVNNDSSNENIMKLSEYQDVPTTIVETNYQEQETVVQQHQAKVRAKMTLNYSKNHTVRVFKEGDIITLQVPCKDRAATDSKRITGLIIKIPHPGKHQIQTKYGILKCLEGTKDLNGVAEENWDNCKNMLKDAPITLITLLKATSKDSTSTRINVSCFYQ